jgi:hypothetical protein
LQVATDQAAAVRDALTAVENRLRRNEQATQVGERADQLALIARLEGMLEVLTPLNTTPPAPDDVHLVLSAAIKVLEAESNQASAELFDAVNKKIVETARRFGMADLQEVKINRAAHLRVIKVGGPPETFSNQSNGARLRIAVAVALLRVGNEHGIATHPGLLLIDSPKAEEVQDVDATALFSELERAAADLPGLQVIVTTVDEPLARKVLAASNIIAPEVPGGPLW